MTITVTIPPQEYDKAKYLGTGCFCYLEDALHKAGYLNVRVYGIGRTEINGRFYVTTEPFGHTKLRTAFIQNQSVTVTLRPS